MQADGQQGERMHRFIDAQPLDVRPIDDAGTLTRELLGIEQGREFDELGARVGFEAREHAMAARTVQLVTDFPEWRWVRAPAIEPVARMPELKTPPSMTPTFFLAASGNTSASAGCSNSE